MNVFFVACRTDITGTMWIVAPPEVTSAPNLVGLLNVSNISLTLVLLRLYIYGVKQSLGQINNYVTKSRQYSLW